MGVGGVNSPAFVSSQFASSGQVSHSFGVFALSFAKQELSICTYCYENGIEKGTWRHNIKSARSTPSLTKTKTDFGLWGSGIHWRQVVAGEQHFRFFLPNGMSQMKVVSWACLNLIMEELFFTKFYESEHLSTNPGSSLKQTLPVMAEIEEAALSFLIITYGSKDICFSILY